MMNEIKNGYSLNCRRWDTAMRRILMITFHFPPDNTSGAHRALKFAKYLPLYGWLPIILSVKSEYYETLDAHGLSEIPAGTDIYRCPVIRPLNLIKKFLRWKNKKTPKIEASQTSTYKKDLITTIKKIIVESVTMPDKYVGWLPCGAIIGFWVLFRNKITTIYSTSPYFSAHLIGLVLHMVSSKRWIVDIRDLHIVESDYNIIRRKLEGLILRIVFQKCNVVICTTKHQRRYLIRRYPYSDPAKYVVITNGYDSSDFEELELMRKENTNQFIISHIGTLFPGLRYPTTFLHAIARLLATGAVSKKQLKVYFVGPGPYARPEEFVNPIKELGLSDVVYVVNRVSHRESIRYMLNSDLLLLLQNSEQLSTAVPAKLFEYFKTRKPILVLAPNGATREIVEKYRAGDVIDPKNVEGIMEKIIGHWKRRKLQHPCSVPDDWLRQFDRKYLTGQLAEHLVSL